MNCGSCGRQVEPQVKFCVECGAPMPGRSGNTASTGGGDVYGGLYQAGRDVVVNPPPDVPPTATYEAVPKWRSPFTQGLLSWAGLIVGLMSLFPLWKLLQPAIGLFSSGPAGGLDSGVNMAWLVAFMVLVLVLALIGSLRSVIKGQLRKPLMFGWAVNGSGRSAPQYCPCMKPDEAEERVARLVASLDATSNLLDQHGESYWTRWIRGAQAEIEAQDANGLRRLSQAYGGMGSFNDLVLSHLNGHQINPDQEHAANHRLDTLRSTIYSEVTALLHDLSD